MANEKYSWMEQTNPELLSFYRSSNTNQKKFVDLLVKGMNNTTAYKYAGYRTSNPAQAASILYHSKSWIKEFVEVAKEYIKKKTMSSLVDNPNSSVDDFIKVDESKSVEAQILAQASKDDIERLHFYEDVIRGGVRQKIVTKTRGENGELIVSKIETKEPTISERMSARKEIDKILGLADSSADNLLDTPSEANFVFNVEDTSKDGDVKEDNSILPSDYTPSDDEDDEVIEERG